MITICDECESVHTIDDKKQYLVHASAKISQVPNHNHSIMLQLIPGQSAKHWPKRATQKS